MAVSLFTFVDLYSRVLDTAAHILDKGVAHAATLRVSENDMLDWRLIEDMQPLRFQLKVVCDFSTRWPARVADLPLPDEISPDVGVAEFKTAIAEAKTWLAALTPTQFADRDDVPLTVTLGTGYAPTFPAGQWLTVFATTNMYFHLSTAYAILRARGTPIGKVDLFPSGL